MEKNSGMQHGPTRFMQLSVICLISNLHIQGRIGRLDGWHLPGGPVGLPAKWATTSNVEVDQTTYPANRGKVGREEREGYEGQSYKEEDREVETGIGEGPRGPNLGRVSSDKLFAEPPSFLVVSLLMGPICLLRPGSV